MIKFEFIWDLEDDPDGNVVHIAEHGITIEEVEDVLSDPDSSTTTSRTSDRAITFGEDREGRYLAVVWETALDDRITIYPITAYPVPRPRERPRKGR